jgi:hypothetical protein
VVREKRTATAGNGGRRVIPVEWSPGGTNSGATGPTTPNPYPRAVDTVKCNLSGAGGQDPPRSASAHCAGEAPPQAKGRCAPFAALPHAIGSDTRLSATARVLALALLSYARDRDRCHPSNAGLAAYVGCSTATIKRALGELEAAGYVRATYGRLLADNPTGRVLALVWREAPATLPEYRPRTAPRAADAPAPRVKGEPRRRSVAVEKGETPPVGPPMDQVREAPEKVVTRPATNEGSVHQVQRERPAPIAEGDLVKRLLALGGPAAQQARAALARRQGCPPNGQPRKAAGVPRERSGAGEGPSAGTFAVALSRLAGGAPAQACADPPRSMCPGGTSGTPALLGQLGPGCDRAAVELAVRALVRDLADPHSQAFYARTLGEVRAGRLASEAVLVAYERARGPRIRNRGSVFVSAVKRWGQ